MAKVRVNNLHKSFGRLEVLRGIDLEVREGEVVCLIGPSGSGKSTFLRCLNFLETPTSGEVEVDGHILTDGKADLNKIRENIGMVFQQFNLFPHLNVLDNITMAPLDRKNSIRRPLNRKRARCSNVSAWRTRLLFIRHSFPAASNSAWPLPARSLWIRILCCSMNQPLRSILRWSARCSQLCGS